MTPPTVFPSILVSLHSSRWRGLALLALASGCVAPTDDPTFDRDDAPFDVDDEVLDDVPSVRTPLPADAPEPRAVDEQEIDPPSDDPIPAPGGLTDHERDPVHIATETASANGGVRRVTDYYLNPLYAETSYATPDIPGCSATMIGPNMLITAAHCGADGNLTLDATGRVYRERDLLQPQTEVFDCNLLFHTFPETDLAIYHCPDPAFGQSLGDRFGWVDVEPTDPAQYSYVFSVFSNGINDIAGVGAASLLTMGFVSETNVANSWPNPNSPHGSVVDSQAQGENQIAQVNRTELWSNFGSSGSGQFDSTGALIIGPQSTGIADNLGRWSLNMRDYLFYGWIYDPLSGFCPTPVVDCGTDNTVNAAYVMGLGLNPNSYTDGYADKDLDWFFDLVSDVEDLEGENAKLLYHLDFGSRRQARQWSMGVGSTIQPNHGRVDYSSTAGGMNNAWAEIARHPNLNLGAGNDYEVTFDLDSTTGWYRVCLDGTSTVCSPFFQDASNDGETTHRLSLVAPAGEPELVIQGWNASGYLHDVSVTSSTVYDLIYQLPQGLTGLYHYLNDFDSFDRRNAWFDPDAPVRPIILPDGQGTGVDWAARISTVNGGGAGFDYDIATHALPFPADGSGTLCFDHRRDPSATWQGQSWGRVRIDRADGAYVGGAYFSPGNDWGETCVDVTASLATGEALEVSFGMYTAGAGIRMGTYFLDRVEVRLPS